jgi:hypothetical protein
VDDGFSVEIIEVGEDPRLEFFLRCDANAAEHGQRHFGKEAFDEISQEPCFGVNTKVKRPSGWAASRVIASNSIKSVASIEISITCRGAAMRSDVLLVFPSDYNMWGATREPVQLVGSMESTY